MAKTDFKSVDEYIATHPRNVQTILQRVRSTLRNAVPRAEEVISYQIPAYKLGGLGLVSFAAATFLALVSPSLAAERYTNASVDEAGTLRIVTRDGRTILLPKEPEQVDFDRIAISPDDRSVGWLARFPNGATSYPIPLKLVVYSGGRRRTYTGNELPVWLWHFTAGGKQIAFEQETVHGGRGVHYELRDVASGRKIAEYSPILGPDDQPEPDQKAPEWVLELDAKR